MKKTILTFLLVAIFVVTAFAGCKPTPQPEPEPKPDVPNMAFSVTTKSLYVGETYQTELTKLADGENVTDYQSNNSGVATINAQGAVTAVSVGNATIKAVTNQGRQALMRIEVLSSDMVYVPYIAFSANPISVAVGDTYAIDYVVSYMGKSVDATLEWSSSDEKIAKVNNGVVSAFGEGSCVITAECTYNGQKVVSKAVVNVAKYGIAVSTDFDNRELFVTQTVDLRLCVSDNGRFVTPDNVVFESANVDIALIEGNKLTAKSGGNAEITAKFSYNGADYEIKRNVYIYGYRVVTIKANGKTDSTLRGIVYGDKVKLDLKKPVSGRQIKCWYVDGIKIDGDSFVMPDKNVVCEAKLTNQTEGNFTKNFANGTLFSAQATYEYVTGSLVDKNNKDVTDGNYVLLDSVTNQNAGIVFNFDESVAVSDSASITIRVKMSGTSKLYVGTQSVVKCVAGVSVALENATWKQSVEGNLWTELRIPLNIFAENGNFLSAVSLGVYGVVYVDYIMLNY